jgi:hypothetical protein
MGNKTLYIATENTVPTANDKFTFGNAEDSKQLQSGRLTDIKAGMGVEVCLEVYDAGTACSVADQIVGFVVPASLNGYNLTAAIAAVTDPGTASASETMDITIEKYADGTGTDMLATEITVTEAEYTASDGVIDTDNDDVATGDVVYVNVDVVHAGTAANGLFVTLTFSK